MTLLQRSLLIAYNTDAIQLSKEAPVPGTPFLLDRLNLLRRSEQEQVPCHPARMCLSDGVRVCARGGVFRPATCFVYIFLAAAIRRPCSIPRRGCRNAVTRGE